MHFRNLGTFRDASIEQLMITTFEISSCGRANSRLLCDAANCYASECAFYLSEEARNLSKAQQKCDITKEIEMPTTYSAKTDGRTGLYSLQPPLAVLVHIYECRQMD
ncbi:hypothetical protein CEXT_797991 [Caerostris extrusa]|uniref:Uncharacterized protein n=1 Tax=Caerostris extrusa TaxID=172846 RepID=A0AAV4V6C8_CAEEX|nr:hypothetical protein CEXT_797991 [Caerostris extrusa]